MDIQERDGLLGKWIPVHPELTGSVPTVFEFLLTFAIICELLRPLTKSAAVSEIFDEIC